MIIRHQNKIVNNYHNFALKTANGILGINSHYDQAKDNNELINIPNTISICMIGDGVISDGKIRNSLSMEFGEGYFEEILKNAYLKRVIDEDKKYFDEYKTYLQIISNGIQSILNTKIYDLQPEGKVVYIGNQIECHINYHNEKNLKCYKSILDMVIEKINWVIDFANGNYNDWDKSYNAQNYVGDNLDRCFRRIEDLLKKQNTPLDLTRHLAKYHYLPTDKIHSISPHDIIKIIEIINNRLRYDKFIIKLANFINEQDAKLRTIPPEIELNDNLWFLSLNWCNSDINNHSLSNLLKLHGSCQNYSSMILPTQELRDSFIVNDNYTDKIAFNLMQRCNTLYLWGISLNDYDTEIHYLISAGRNISKIIVINPCSKVYERVRSLVNIYELDKGIEIIHIKPSA